MFRGDFKSVTDGCHKTGSTKTVCESLEIVFQGWLTGVVDRGWLTGVVTGGG